MILRRWLYSIILFGLLFTFSCKKYKPETLEGDLSYLVGTWDWDSTFHEYNWCTGGSTIEETIYPEENNFSVRFEEEGFVSFFANDSLLRRESIRIDTFLAHSSDSRQVIMHLNGDPQDIISGSGTFDLTEFTHFPFDANDGGCEDYDNYFSKR